MEFYYVYFLFQLKEMVDGITREVATLTFRFEHDQASGVPSPRDPELSQVLYNTLSLHCEREPIEAWYN